MAKKSAPKDGYVYTNKPFWLWVVLYLIAGLFVYALAYYFLFPPKGGSPLGY